MLTLHVEAKTLFNNTTEEFFEVPDTTLQLEHSLISLKKWEQKWHKPFLTSNKNDEKTHEEIRDYIRCMTITNNVDPNVYFGLTEEQEMQVVKYIEDPMTATWFSDNNIGATSSNREVITNEIIYYWMLTLGIPFSCEKWHLNSLLTLIKVVNIKSQPPKKMSASAAAAERRALNNARRAKYNTRG